MNMRTSAFNLDTIQNGDFDISDEDEFANNSLYMQEEWEKLMKIYRKIKKDIEIFVGPSIAEMLKKIRLKLKKKEKWMENIEENSVKFDEILGTIVREIDLFIQKLQATINETIKKTEEVVNDFKIELIFIPVIEISLLFAGSFLDLSNFNWEQVALFIFFCLVFYLIIVGEYFYKKKKIRNLDNNF